MSAKRKEPMATVGMTGYSSSNGTTLVLTARVREGDFESAMLKLRERVRRWLDNPHEDDEAPAQPTGSTGERP